MRRIRARGVGGEGTRRSRRLVGEGSSTASAVGEIGGDGFNRGGNAEDETFRVSAVGEVMRRSRRLMGVVGEGQGEGEEEGGRTTGGEAEAEHMAGGCLSAAEAWAEACLSVAMVEVGEAGGGRAERVHRVYERQRSRWSRRLLGESPVVAVSDEGLAAVDEVVAEEAVDVAEETVAEETVADETVAEETVAEAEEEEAVAEEADDIGGGGADSLSDGSSDFRIEYRSPESYLAEDDSDIGEEEVRQTYSSTADDVNRCMGYSFDVGSDYGDSENINEVADGSEDEVDMAVRFNARTDMEDPKFDVGMVFESFDVLKHAIRTYSIKRRYPVTINKNDKLRVRAHCGDSCPWTLYAAPYRLGRGGVQIRTLIDEHNCVRGFTNKFATSKWIAEAYYDVIRMNPEIKTGQLLNYVQRDYNLHVKRHKVGRARRLALALLRGDEKEQYSKLADYVAELRSTNQNSTLILSLDNLVFKKLFICLTPCKLGFLAGCRPVICLDGCFLKGLYGGQILTAVAVDPNDGIWPIAYAVVDVECRESWAWFLQLLGEELGMDGSHMWTFMSDRQKVS